MSKYRSAFIHQMPVMTLTKIKDADTETLKGPTYVMEQSLPYCIFKPVDRSLENEIIDCPERWIPYLYIVNALVSHILRTYRDKFNEESSNYKLCERIRMLGSFCDSAAFNDSLPETPNPPEVILPMIILQTFHEDLVKAGLVSDDLDTAMTKLKAYIESI